MEYQHGDHLYEGSHSDLFDIWVCPSCWDSNWDGWSRNWEGVLLAHLKKKGLPVPKRNPKGLFPRG
jgi:hypothetical protein